MSNSKKLLVDALTPEEKEQVEFYKDLITHSWSKRKRDKYYVEVMEILNNAIRRHKNETRLTTNIKKFEDGGLGIQIPQELVEKLNIKDGSEVNIIVDNRLIKIDSTSPTLEELLSQITPENQHEEVDWGKPMGKEIW